MYYLNACELLNACLKAGVLQGEENDHVFVYREAGDPADRYPEGWYKEPFDEAAEAIAGNESGARLLESELEKRGIRPHYTDIEQMRMDMNAFLDFFQTMIDTGHCWTG